MLEVEARLSNPGKFRQAVRRIFGRTSRDERVLSGLRGSFAQLTARIGAQTTALREAMARERAWNGRRRAADAHGAKRRHDAGRNGRHRRCMVICEGLAADP